ncbi:MAG: hypothetical protein ACK4RZ_04790 [Paracoccaceae bacterium]
MDFAPSLFRTGRRVAVFVVAVSAAGCAPLPDMGTPSRGVPTHPPVLVSLDGILAQADAVGTAAGVIAPVSARASQLRDRADRLRRQ